MNLSSVTHLKGMVMSCYSLQKWALNHQPSPTPSSGCSELVRQSLCSSFLLWHKWPRHSLPGDCSTPTTAHSAAPHSPHQHPGKQPCKTSRPNVPCPGAAEPAGDHRVKLLGRLGGKEQWVLPSPGHPGEQTPAKEMGTLCQHLSPSQGRASA